MIKVVVVDDSGVTRDVLSHILNSDPEITVIGTASNGEEAIEVIGRKKPDVVTMDINMPKMDGFEATRRIMQTSPVPIVMVSASLLPEEVDKAWRAVEAGAVAALLKPGLADQGASAGSKERLLETVKVMSQVKVVRRWARPAAPPPPPPPAPVLEPPKAREVAVVAIGASTGGPPVLQTIFSRLSENFAAPLLVVQHIAPGFARGFVDWLDRVTPLKVNLSTHRQIARPGNVYVAPDSHQMKVDSQGSIILTSDPPVNGIRPSVAYLFRSVAETFGDRAVGVLLTGMGRDGAEELRLMRDKGAMTICQDKDSSIVFGMPGEAMKLSASRYFLPPERIGDMLKEFVR